MTGAEPSVTASIHSSRLLTCLCVSSRMFPFPNMALLEILRFVVLENRIARSPETITGIESHCRIAKPLNLTSDKITNINRPPPSRFLDYYAAWGSRLQEGEKKKIRYHAFGAERLRNLPKSGARGVNSSSRVNRSDCNAEASILPLSKHKPLTNLSRSTVVRRSLVPAVRRDDMGIPRAEH